MAINMTINGSVFPFPEDGEENWGAIVTACAKQSNKGEKHNV